MRCEGTAILCSGGCMCDVGVGADGERDNPAEQPFLDLKGTICEPEFLEEEESPPIQQPFLEYLA